MTQDHDPYEGAIHQDERAQSMTAFYLILAPIVIGTMSGVFVSAYVYPLSEVQFMAYVLSMVPLAYLSTSLYIRVKSWQLNREVNENGV